MTQILNVPMPADEAIKIIRAMLESNRMIEVHVQDNGAYKNGRTINSLDTLWMVDGTVEDEDDDTCSLSGTVIINSITPIIPTYSVGQEVMILATGEIGEIVRQDRQYARDCYIAFPDEKIGHRGENFHRSEICKIA